MMVFIRKKKLHVSAYSGHLQVLTTFLLKEFYIICLNRVVMLKYHFTCFVKLKFDGISIGSTSPRGLGILYKNLLARKLSKPVDGRYRPKHVVFSIANKHYHLAIYL